MFKHVMKRIIYLLIIGLIVLVILFIVSKCITMVSSHESGMEQAKTAVLEFSQEQLGDKSNVVYEKFDSKNDFYWIGCVNSKNTYAIMYIAKHNKNTKKWKVDVFSTRKGSNASSLFFSKHSLIR